MSSVPVDYGRGLPRGEPGPDVLSRLRRVWSRPRLSVRPISLDAGAAVTLGLFALIFVTALKPVVDLDVFWHLATGRLIWASGHIPLADPFSWTAPGRPWIAQEWLTETGSYALYTHGGPAALMLAFALVVTAAFAITYATARMLGASRLFAGLVTGLAAFASAYTWGIRPQMFTLLCSALCTWLLWRAATTGRLRVLWILPPLMAVWVNLHGGFIFGPVLIGIFALGQTWETLRSRRRTALGHWWAVMAASMLACLLNPNGLRGFVYPFSYLGGMQALRYVAEWVAPDFHQLRYQLFELLILLLLVGLAGAARRPRLTEILLILLFVHLGLEAVRNITLFSAVVAPLIAGYVSSAWSRTTQPLRSWLRPGLLGGLHWRRDATLTPAARGAINLLFAGVLVYAIVVVSVPKLSEQSNGAAQAAEFPIGAATYLRAHHPAGRLLNSYNWGGYLIWTLYPRIRVYVDGRLDMYGDQFMDHYVRLASAGPGWQATLRREDIRLVLVEPNSGLGLALATTHGWRVAYHDQLSILYERTT